MKKKKIRFALRFERCKWTFCISESASVWKTTVECNIMNYTWLASFLPAQGLRGDWGLGTCSAPRGDPWPETRLSCATEKEKRSFLRNPPFNTIKTKGIGLNLTCTCWLYGSLLVGYSCGSFLFGYD